MVLLKDLKNGFVYTNLNSQKGNELKKIRMLRCVSIGKVPSTNKISGKVSLVSDQLQMNIIHQTESRIEHGLLQSEELNSREQLLKSIQDYKKYATNRCTKTKSLVWMDFISNSIEFWLDGENRIHERLKYNKDNSGKWIKSLLSP